MSAKVKFSVVGLGNIGKRHLAVIDNDPNCQIVAICDIDESLCKHYSELYNIPNYFTDFEEMIKFGDFDVVSICTPHGLHCNMTILAAKSKKNVLVEKPMALSVQDCELMIESARENNTYLMVVKQNRFNKPIALTKQAIESGKLGKIYSVVCNVLWNRNIEYYSKSDWRGKAGLEGGVLFTQVSHFLDLLIWWFGDVKKAKTLTQNFKHDIEIEDTGTSIIEFESGVLGSLNWSTCVYGKNYEGSITIIGDKGTIKIGGQYLNKIDYWDIESYPLPDDIVFDDKPNSYGKYQGTSSNHNIVVEEVVKKLLNERGHVVEGNEGIKTIDAIEKIYKSII